MTLIPELLIFDLDNTLVDEKNYYETVYSGSLTRLIAEECGEGGLSELDYCRKNFGGKGELALARLGLPYSAWAQRLIESPTNLITPQPNLVERFRRIPIPKVLFTGSPLEMASRALNQFGLNAQEDFTALYGWQSGDDEPLKWSRSGEVFKAILEKFDLPPRLVWSIGDNWETDLKEAMALGITTVQIGNEIGNPNLRFTNIADFFSFYEILTAERRILF